MRRKVIQTFLFCFFAAVVCSPFAIYILNHFYQIGPYFFDSGWFSYLLSHCKIPPANPLSMAQEGFPYYFTFHISLIVSLWGAIAQFAHLNAPNAFAAFQWFFHGLLFSTGLLLGRNYSVPAKAQRWFCIFFGFALTFSPVTVGAIMFPHIEITIPILFLAFCALLGNRKLVTASLAFLLMLFVREDAGFHAFAFLMSYAVLEMIQRRTLGNSAKFSLAFATIGFLYSIAAFVFQHFAFPNFSLFGAEYAGVGWYEHESMGLIQNRIENLGRMRPELFVIASVPVAFFIIRRDLTELAGTAAILPWVALHFTAFRVQLQLLDSYFAFPFLITLAWPWVLTALRKVDEKTALQKDHATRDQIVWACFWALSIFFYFTTPLSNDPHWANSRRAAALSFFPQVTVAEIEQVNRFAKVLGAAIKKDKTPILVDDAVLSLIPGQTGAAHKFDGAAAGGRIASPANSFVVIYYNNSVYYPNIKNSPFWAAANSCFGVIGTNIRLLVRGDVSQIVPELTPMLIAMECNSRAL